MHDLYFDDATWTLRYLVVDTGSWLAGRKVLLPASAAAQADAEGHAIAVGLSRERIRHSPDWNEERPVSRQLEAQIYTYYGWPLYWAGGGAAGGLPVPAPVPPVPLVPAPSAPPAPGDPHLRSAMHISGFFGYRLETTDGALGHVADLLVEDASWVVRYVVVDVATFWSRRRVLVPPAWVREIRWADGAVRVGLTREALVTAPRWDAARPVDSDLEARIVGHYGRRRPMSANATEPAA